MNLILTKKLSQLLLNVQQFLQLFLLLGTTTVFINPCKRMSQMISDLYDTFSDIGHTVNLCICDISELGLFYL